MRQLSQCFGLLVPLIFWSASFGAANDLSDSQSDRGVANAAAGEDVGSRKPHPLQQIGTLMAEVKSQLRDRDTSQKTLTMQRNIIDGLSQLIESQSQSPTSSSQQSAQSGQPQPPRPAGAEQSGATSGEGTPQTSGVDSAGDTELLFQQVWGHLPDQVRRQMETPLHEKFLPQYDDVIQSYFKRLARENRE